MSQQELLIRVIGILDSNAIDYMLTGSLASSIQGEPRSTHDIDIVITIKQSQVESFIQSFPGDEFYVNRKSVFHALDQKRMFNVIHSREGLKIDFWILTDSPFDRSRFSRKYVENFFGEKILASMPEDTILSKLRWARLSGGSEKQFIDALRVFEIQYENLDMSYLEKWAKNLDIEDLWEELKRKAKPYMDKS